jgi:anti-sigma regulatory factor (Ser/Thr protein kinase)
MLLGSISKKYIFNNQAVELYNLTLAIVNNISETVKVDEHLAFKLKMVLVELLTNSLKHSGQNETTLETELSADKIIIKKTDRGEAFAINTAQAQLKWPVPAENVGGSIVIYEDAIASLNVTIPQASKAIFFVKDHELVDAGTDSINTLSEHFGLLIITRACNSFRYEFDPKNGTNHFIASLLTNGDS